jgi:hypothetical protein
VPTPAGTRAPNPEPSRAPTDVLATGPAPCAPSDRFAADDGHTLVVYHKRGGFAFVDETLIVRDDGSLQVNAERGGTSSGQVSPATLAPLRTLLASPEVAALSARYGIAVPADGYLYEVFIPCPGGARSIVTLDGTKNPPALDALIEALDQLRRDV